MEEVLRELEANNKPRLHVMNKIDLLSEIKRESLIDTDAVIHVSAKAKVSTGCCAASIR